MNRIKVCDKCGTPGVDELLYVDGINICRPCSERDDILMSADMCPFCDREVELTVTGICQSCLDKEEEWNDPAKGD